MSITREIVQYFAQKRMGSEILNLVDLIWDELDDIERQMAVSLKNAGSCQFNLRSNLSQKELDDQFNATPYINLV